MRGEQTKDNRGGGMLHGGVCMGFGRCRIMGILQRVRYNRRMNKSNVISVNENSPEFIADLKRRVAIAKNPKNRIQLRKSKKNILQKYRKLTRAAV